MYKKTWNKSHEKTKKRDKTITKTCKTTTRGHKMSTERQNKYNKTQNSYNFKSGGLASVLKDWGAFYMSVPRGPHVCHH